MGRQAVSSPPFVMMTARKGDSFLPGRSPYFLLYGLQTGDIFAQYVELYVDN